MLDKTGTITLGNRQASGFIPVKGVTDKELADAAQLASLADETPEGRSIVVLTKEKYGLRGGMWEVTGKKERQTDTRIPGECTLSPSLPRPA